MAFIDEHLFAPIFRPTIPLGPELLYQNACRLVVIILFGEAKGGPVIDVLGVDVGAVRPHQHSCQLVVVHFRRVVEGRFTRAVLCINISAQLTHEDKRRIMLNV